MKFNWNKNDIPILQLGSVFYDQVTAAKFPEMKLRYWNSSIPINIDQKRLWDFNPLQNNLNAPLALKYHGHQFQHYNPDLGDGRGFLYAQFKINDQWFDLGTKGSGQTPYSRRGDGRLTLKGAFREALATELLESLHVNTSKTLCFYETGEALERGDEPSPTRSAVMTRFTKGHIRIGTFQRLAYFEQFTEIKKLVSYCLHFYYQDEIKDLDFDDELLVASHFLRLVCKRNAELVADIMASGFVHGVLNTDNINISGELFDYGPYRFMPQYDPNFTAAYFDHQSLYAFGRQPHAFLWNLHQLGFSLQKAYPDLPFQSILEDFSDEFNSSFQIKFLKRLNLKSPNSEATAKLISLFFLLMDQKKLFFEQTFFDFYSFDLSRLMRSPQAAAYTGDTFDQLVKLIEGFTILESNQIHSKYHQQEKPTTLLIDEIESIWSHIAQNDDWSFFEKKLQSIRLMR